MKCPKCGKELRISEKYPGYGLCDYCRKKYRLIDDDDYELGDFEEKEYTFKSPKTRVILTDRSVKIIKSEHNYMISKNQRGEHTIFYSQIVEVKLKKASAFSKGFIQFTTAQTHQLAGALRSMNQAQNAIQFSKSEESDILEIKEIVENMI